MCFSVLIVDDEKMPREILHHYIPWEEYGVRSVYEAQDGESALELPPLSCGVLLFSHEKED